jgi:hypothetical protein
MKVKNGPKKDNLKEKPWHKTFGTESSSNSGLLHLQQALKWLSRDGICIARPIGMEFECLMNGFCLIRWILSIECPASRHFEAEGVCQAEVLRFG